MTSRGMNVIELFVFTRKIIKTNSQLLLFVVLRVRRKKQDNEPYKGILTQPSEEASRQRTVHLSASQIPGGPNKGCFYENEFAISLAFQTYKTARFVQLKMSGKGSTIFANAITLFNKRILISFQVSTLIDRYYSNYQGSRTHPTGSERLEMGIGPRQERLDIQIADSVETIFAEETRQ